MPEYINTHNALCVQTESTLSIEAPEEKIFINIRTDDFKKLCADIITAINFVYNVGYVDGRASKVKQETTEEPVKAKTGKKKMSYANVSFK